jgi:hypothetical protein
VRESLGQVLWAFGFAGLGICGWVRDARRSDCQRATFATNARPVNAPVPRDPRCCVVSTDDRAGQQKVIKSIPERPSSRERMCLNHAIWPAAARTQERLKSTFNPRGAGSSPARPIRPEKIREHPRIAPRSHERTREPRDHQESRGHGRPTFAAEGAAPRGRASELPDGSTPGQQRDVERERVRRTRAFDPVSAARVVHACPAHSSTSSNSPAAHDGQKNMSEGCSSSPGTSSR